MPQASSATVYTCTGWTSSKFVGNGELQLRCCSTNTDRSLRVTASELCSPYQASGLPLVRRYHNHRESFSLMSGRDIAPASTAFAAAALLTIAYAPMIPFRCPSFRNPHRAPVGRAQIVTHRYTTSVSSRRCRVYPVKSAFQLNLNSILKETF